MLTIDIFNEIRFGYEEEDWHWDRNATLVQINEKLIRKFFIAKCV